MNKEFKRVYTHPAPHHIDEVMAIAILRQSFDCQIVETPDIPDGLFGFEPEKDLAVDIGKKYDGVSYFDHHQNDESVKGESSLSLIVKHFAPELMEHEGFRSFVTKKTEQDNNGLSCYSTTSKEDLGVLMFIERRILNMPIDESTEFLSEWVIKPVLDEIKIAEEIRQELHYEPFGLNGVKENGGRISNDPANIRIKNEVSRDLLKDSPAKFLISPSIRNTGEFNILRRDESLDLNVLNGLEGVSFVHKAGFIASLRLYALDEAVRILDLEISGNRNLFD